MNKTQIASIELSFWFWREDRKRKWKDSAPQHLVIGLGWEGSTVQVLALRLRRWVAMERKGDHLYLERLAAYAVGLREM